jgi:hypothetical protein
LGQVDNETGLEKFDLLHQKSNQFANVQKSHEVSELVQNLRCDQDLI